METKAVLKNDKEAMAALQANKMTLMERYKSLSEGLERDKSALDQLDDDVRKHLKDVSAKFQTAMQDNLKAIKSAHNAVNRLMDRIMTTARRAVMQGQQQYNSKGAFAGEHNKLSMTPTKVNQEY
jgi:vancomycin resistance protein YoaR